MPRPRNDSDEDEDDQGEDVETLWKCSKRGGRAGRAGLLFGARDEKPRARARARDGGSGTRGRQVARSRR